MLGLMRLAPAGRLARELLLLDLKLRLESA